MRTKKKQKFGYILAIVVATLIILGLLVSVKISADVSQKQFGNTTYYLFHQLIYGFLFGIVLGFVVFKTPLSFIKKWSWSFILMSLILMGLIFVPGLKISSGGASRWINFGKFTFQPSEFLKLAFIIYLSALLARGTSKKKSRKEWKLILVPFLVVLGLIIGFLYFQSDLSTLMVITITALIIYFSSGAPIWHSVLISSIGLSAFFALTIFSSYRIERVFVLLGLKRDPLGIGYQIKQISIAIGSGGIFGLGLGMSQQAALIPNQISDSIFAVIAEELGLAGSLVLIFLYLVFLWRGIKIARSADNKFSQLFAIGLTSWICVQAFINIGAMVKILPLTGIPLPFISYGGSHIVVELIGVGILLNISKFKKK